MAVAKMLAIKTANLTNQQIVDFALAEDRAKRAALKRGDVDAANTHANETAELLRNLK